MAPPRSARPAASQQTDAAHGDRDPEEVQQQGPCPGLGEDCSAPPSLRNKPSQIHTFNSQEIHVRNIRSRHPTA